MRKHWSNISGLAVVPIHEFKILGHLNGLFMNPETGQVIAYLVGLTQVVSPVDIAGWKRDRIQVKYKDALVLPTEILRLQHFGLKRCFLNGKRVRSKSGKNLGRVRDFTLETTTDSVLHFAVSKGFLGMTWSDRVFSYQHVSEVTEDAIILMIEPEDLNESPKGKKIPAASVS